ncbi:hypothetical protein K490DRAFT_62107 [Saccharata proteae CBS 121410]|uniref:Uncharacterized protein n=1 Tax=Saccharata proteae CBS 121410 TaxID=1314787 RepID=A0A9P4LYY4_9PEZI|nr:hypothetical protein K490DRAFT_62107 [Saccharata proteae CBS 121410]
MRIHEYASDRKAEVDILLDNNLCDECEFWTDDNNALCAFLALGQKSSKAIGLQYGISGHINRATLDIVVNGTLRKCRDYQSEAKDGIFRKSIFKKGCWKKDDGHTIQATNKTKELNADQIKSEDGRAVL